MIPLPPGYHLLAARRFQKAWDRRRKLTLMTIEYLVGINIGGKHGSVTVEAEDALIAALKVKHEKPSAKITYARKRNKRGDLRHPSHDIAEEG